MAVLVTLAVDVTVVVPVTTVISCVGALLILIVMPYHGAALATGS